MQILGARDMVPAYALEDGSPTDRFYGSFGNAPEPEWPVCRLPLGPGEYRAFFAEYRAFALETGLQGPDYWETHADAPREPGWAEGAFGLIPPNPAVMALCVCSGEMATAP